MTRWDSAYQNKQVRVIDETGKMVGVFQFEKALNYAVGKGYDLILLNDGDIPVVKIADYNKVLFEQKKKAKEAKKNQIVQKQKELVFGVNIAENDYNTKLAHAREFLSESDKVKITIKMERRLAQSNSSIGFALAERVINDLYEYGSIKDKPKQFNNLIFINIDPKK